MSERAFGAAWSAAVVGARAEGSIGRVPSLLRLGEIALREGDPATTIACADALDALPDGVDGDVERRHEESLVLRCMAMEPGPGYARLVRAVRQAPEDPRLGDALVRIAEKLHPVPKAGRVALEDARKAPSVLAATVGELLRARAWRQAVDLGERAGLVNEARAHALLRVGRVAEAHGMFESFGERGAVHFVLDGIERRDETSLARGLVGAPATVVTTAERAARGATVDAAMAWKLFSWIEAALDLRAEALATRLVGCLPMPRAERAALHALFMYEAGILGEALNLALTVPSEPDAAEVIGLVALAHGDMEAAGTMLAARVRAGDPSVRATRGAVVALRHLRRDQDASALLAIGLEARPHARGLALLAKDRGEKRGRPRAA